MAETTTLETKLADMKQFHDVLLESEQKLMTATNDDTIRERLEGMMKSDLDNLGTIEKAISKASAQAEPRDITQKYAEKVGQMMNNSELSLSAYTTRSLSSNCSSISKP